MTVSFVLKLDPNELENADLDLRYRIPEAIEAASKGRVVDDGYDYDDEDCILIFLKAKTEKDLQSIIQVLKGKKILKNDLSKTGVAIEGRAGTCRFVYPPDLEGETFKLDS
jgi:hypothetical protein